MGREGWTPRDLSCRWAPGEARQQGPPPGGYEVARLAHAVAHGVTCICGAFLWRFWTPSALGPKEEPQQDDCAEGP